MNMKKIMILGLAVLAMLAVGCQKELTENEKALAELNEAYQAFLMTNPSPDSILAFTDKFDELSWSLIRYSDRSISKTSKIHSRKWSKSISKTTSQTGQMTKKVV